MFSPNNTGDLSSDDNIAANPVPGGNRKKNSVEYNFSAKKSSRVDEAEGTRSPLDTLKKKICEAVGKKNHSTHSSFSSQPETSNRSSSPASIKEYLYYFSDDEPERNRPDHVTTATTTTKTRTGAPSDSRGCRTANTWVVDSKMGSKEDLSRSDSGNENNNEFDKEKKGERKHLVQKEVLQNEDDDVEKNQPLPNKAVIFNNESKEKNDKENKLLVQVNEKTKNMKNVDDYNEEFENGKKISPSSAKMTPYFVCLVLASTCGFLVTGYQMAVVSGLLLLNKDIPVTPFWRQTLVGVASAMAMAITVTCGQLCDKIGRRYMVMLSAVIAILGASIETSGLYHTLPGRILAGMSIGK